MKKQLKRRTLTRWIGTRAAALLGMGLPTFAAVGCAESVGDIDRTQPDLISKDHFRGQWFVRETVVDVPESFPGAFIGWPSGLESVVWDIQEDWLIGYRSYELHPGADPRANTDLATPNSQPVTPDLGDGRNPEVFKGNPVVAYRIIKHADVQRGYNARTGEQNNVISENSSDRPWFERSFMRVDWSADGVGNLNMLQPLFGRVADISQFVSANEGGSDAFNIETDEEGLATYIDFTVRRTVAPSLMGCRFLPMGDCTSEEIKVRTSLVKIDVEREQDYVPMIYGEQRQGEFGYFRTQRIQYDRKFGNTYTDLIQMANRHDIWQNSRSENGVPKAYAARSLRPIVYTLSENYPEDLIEVTQQMTDEYDASFKEVARAARGGQSLEDLEADILADTGDTCLFCLDLNADNGARIGDVRRNFIYWVDPIQARAPLGFGPHSSHPETGRIVSANAYVYGANVDRYTNTAMQMIDLINGQIDDADLQDASYARELLRQNRNPIDPRAKSLQLGPVDAPELGRRLLGEADFARLTVLEEQGAEGFGRANPGLDQARVDAMVGTPAEALLIPDEWQVLQQADTADVKFLTEMNNRSRQEALDRGETPAPESDFGPFSVSNWMGPNALKEDEEYRRLAHENNVWLAEFSDPALVGLAKEMSESGLTGDALFQELRKRIYRGVMLHELGHTVGLRHNFGGSSDSLNYHSEYWDERIKTIEPVDQFVNGQNPSPIAFLNSNCSSTGALTLTSGEVLTETDTTEECQAQREAQMGEYQYASIMDYGGRFNSDIHGLGYYDHAALASGYGDLVEVFDAEAMAGTVVGSAAFGVNVREALLSANEVRNPILGQGLDVAMMFQGQAGALHSHYTNFPTLFGGHENFAKRAFMPRSEYLASLTAGGDQSLTPVKVPYLSCYDEFVDTIENCHRWDIGADPFEIVADKLSSYEDYYVFNYFQRDRLGFNPVSVFRRTLGRYFAPLANMYQHWLWNNSVTRLSPQGTARGDLGFIASRQGLNKLMDVLSTPRPGAHVLDADSGVYVPAAGTCPADASPVPLPNADGSGFVEVANCIDVPKGVGRNLSSRYDSSGYGVYDRVLEAGHIYDQIAAISALSLSNASVVGIGSDTALADRRTFRIPYNLVFEDELSEMYTSIFTEDYTAYARKSYVPEGATNGLVLGRDLLGPVTGDDMAALPSVQPIRSFTMRVQALRNGAQMFDNLGLNSEYARRGQLFLDGTGEEREVPPGFEQVQLTNPLTGRTYIAHRQIGDDTGSWYAADILDSARATVEVDLGALDAGGRARAEADIEGIFSELELVRLFANGFGR